VWMDVMCRSVSCGHEHTVAITSKDVLAWGSNEWGQLGLGDSAQDMCSRPYPIRHLHDMMVTQVVCGKYHTICVTAQSQVSE
jgi:alpha-tubulin suppressor-like RCC1 family protein